ncbi:MAG: hypothetical protein A2Z88_09965 [Omnitrophica WOR_2 bacterium GWA2_47_8]|nr:MAG: hypothetical protein A2Z88_09965 [Omnitrophica WOR_2 bacterium GWA2_47_8]
MFYTYILINLVKTKTYVGSTQNIEQRLKEHNRGKVTFTRKFLPYQILHVENFVTNKEARARERFYKTTSGRRRIKELIAGEIFRKDI